MFVSTKWAETDSAECMVVVSYFLPWTRLESASGVEGLRVFVPAPYMAWGVLFMGSKLEKYKTFEEALHADQLLCTKQTSLKHI